MKTNITRKINLQLFAEGSEKRLNEIEARKQEIRSLLIGDSAEVKIDELEQELRGLETEKKNIERRKAIADGIGAGTIQATVIPKAEPVQQRSFEGMAKDQVIATPEYRSAFLKNLQGKELDETEKRALTTASNSAGPAVPTTTLNMIVDKLRQTSVLFTKIKVSYVPGNLSIVVANAKNAAAWKTEGGDGTAADDTVINVNLTGFELIKLVEISVAADSMTIDAFEQYISDEIGRQLAVAIENAILNGTGSGQPTGILAGITWAAGNSTTWTTAVGYDNLMDGLGLLPTMYHPNAVFVMNRKMLFGGVRKIKAADGQPIFAYNAQDRAGMTILGYPVILDDYMPDDAVLLGDLEYYYMNFSKSPEVSSSREASFKSGKVTYRGLAVADGKPALAEAFVKISKAS